MGGRGGVRVRGGVGTQLPPPIHEPGTLRVTVDKWAVRILLEYFLVIIVIIIIIISRLCIFIFAVVDKKQIINS